MQNSVISTRITRLYWFHPSSVVLCIQNRDLTTTIACVYGSQTSPVIFCMINSCLTSELLISVSPDLICGFCMQNSAFWTRIANFYQSQISPAVLCLQRSVISARTTCLYGSKTIYVVFACKTATFGAELQVCMGPRPHLSFCACKLA